MPTLRLEEPEWPQPPLVKTTLLEQREPAPLLASLSDAFGLYVSQVSLKLSNTCHT